MQYSPTWTRTNDVQGRHPALGRSRSARTAPLFEQTLWSAAWDCSYAQIKQAVARIATHPRVGKLPDELTALNLRQYRQVLAHRNRILYELRDELAFVHVICDARMDLRTLLMRRILEVEPLAGQDGS